jgi:hypothetical protein
MSEVKVNNELKLGTCNFFYKAPFLSQEKIFALTYRREYRKVSSLGEFLHWLKLTHVFQIHPVFFSKAGLTRQSFKIPTLYRVIYEE